MYKAIVDFVDLQDNHKYHVGDVFPRMGYDPGEERIAELASAENKRGCAVIEEVPEKGADKPVEEPVELTEAEVVDEPVKAKGKPRRKRSSKEE